MTSGARACAGVLVVEDDVDILRAVVQVLGDEGHTVRFAANGRVALETLRAPGAQLPCVILLDLMMPIMDGWAFRAEQLRDPALAKIPVIILTADGSDANEGLGAGTLRKPVELETLLRVVARYVA